MRLFLTAPCVASFTGRPGLLFPTRQLVKKRQCARSQSSINNLFGGLFGKQEQDTMGSSTSKSAGSEGWKAAPAGSPRGQRLSKSGYDITPMTVEDRQREAFKLTDFQRQVTLNAGTERAFTGKTVDGTPHDSKRKGTYVSAIGDLPLFSSDAKFDSGTGWPSFFQPIDPEHIIEVKDNSIPFMPRIEVVDARSGAHLGHVFNDGPRPTGKRYCINAAALKFIPEGEPLPEGAKPESQKA